jgi:hypothetical protein
MEGERETVLSEEQVTKESGGISLAASKDDTVRRVIPVQNSESAQIFQYKIVSQVRIFQYKIVSQ